MERKRPLGATIFQMLRRQAAAAATWIRGVANMLSRTYAPVHTPTHQTLEKCTFIYLFFFFLLFYFPPGGSALTPGGHPGGCVSPSIIQRVDTSRAFSGITGNVSLCAHSHSDRLFLFFLFLLLPRLHSWLTVLKLNPRRPWQPLRR